MSIVKKRKLNNDVMLSESEKCTMQYTFYFEITKPAEFTRLIASMTKLTAFIYFKINRKGFESHNLDHTQTVVIKINSYEAGLQNLIYNGINEHWKTHPNVVTNDDDCMHIQIHSNDIKNALKNARNTEKIVICGSQCDLEHATIMCVGEDILFRSTIRLLNVDACEFTNNTEFKTKTLINVQNDALLQSIRNMDDQSCVNVNIKVTKRDDANQPQLKLEVQRNKHLKHEAFLSNVHYIADDHDNVFDSDIDITLTYSIFASIVKAFKERDVMLHFTENKMVIIEYKFSELYDVRFFVSEI